MDVYEKVMVEINFPNYKKLDNVYNAYSKFVQEVMNIIDKVAPSRIKRIKRNDREWLDSVILEELIIQDKLFKKSKNLQRHLQLGTVNYAKVHCK